MSKVRDEKIIAACREGNLDLVKQLIEPENVNVDEVMESYGNESKFPPLSAACAGGHLEVVEYLASERRADVNRWVNDPLSKASTAEIVNFLIDKRADIDGLDALRYTPLIWACHKGNLTQAKALIARGANKSVVDRDGNTLLHLCAKNATKVDMLDYLISEGLDFNKANMDGETPFYSACLHVNLDAVQYLAHKGADINKINTKTELTPRESVLEAVEECLEDVGLTLDDLKALDDQGVANYVQNTEAVIRFIDTWNRKDEFVEEVRDFADELWLSNMLFQSYCSGEAMAEPSDQG